MLKKHFFLKFTGKKRLFQTMFRLYRKHAFTIPEKNKTISMRGKEEAHDYRYFPDPDLLPLVIDNPWVDSIKLALPELPNAKKERFITQYKLPSYDAEVLTSSRELADYFEKCTSGLPHPKLVSNWIMGPLLGLINTLGQPISKSPIEPSDLAELLKLLDEGVISGKMAKTIFEDMAESGKSPHQIVKEKGLIQLSDTDALEIIVQNVLKKCAREVTAYQAGKTKLLGFFMGQVMKETKGKANPQVVNDLLKKELGN